MYINEKTQKTQNKQYKNSKYKYTYYQNTHTLQNPHIYVWFLTLSSVYNIFYMLRFKYIDFNINKF